MNILLIALLGVVIACLYIIYEEATFIPYEEEDEVDDEEGDCL